MTLSSQNGELLSGPSIISRGFVYPKEPSDTLMNNLAEMAADAVASSRTEKGDLASVKLAVKNKLGDHLFKQCKMPPNDSPNYHGGINR